MMGRARSVGGSNGIISPLPEEPLDPSLEALTRAGLTPAQAYQVQVSKNRPMLAGSTQERQQAQIPRVPNAGDRHSAPSGLPRIGVSIEADDGRLGIDFLGNHTPSDQGTDSSSDLPWHQQIQQGQQSSRSHPESIRSRTSIVSAFSPIPEQQQATGAPQMSTSSRPYPLQLDTAISAARAAGASTSPASSTVVDYCSSSSAPPSAMPGTSSRRSSESSRTLPGPAFRKDRLVQDRSRSMSATISPQVRAMLENNGRIPRPPVPSMPPPGRDSRSHKHHRTPIVYPALLSRVAQAFKERITLSDRVKDGLTYKDAFDGREAVDKIAYIIKTTDRNLALLLGRALDAQKFFHAVTYDHRLRDSSHDLYQFRTKLPSPFVSGEFAEPDADDAACEMIFSYGFIEAQMDTAETLFLSLSIPENDVSRAAKLKVAECAPGFKIIDVPADHQVPSDSDQDAEGRIDWSGDFIWLLCVGLEDGLEFQLARTADGQIGRAHV